MPLQIPNLDNRTYQQLLDSALARIPVHNPEWTNFNKSDPGVTLIELFAFLTENLLYRCNQIPERNRKKFLSLLGLQLQPASSARGIVSFTNERGPRETFTLNKGIEVRAGQIPFHTQGGLDVLPVEARAYYKKKLDAVPEVESYYKSLYTSFHDTTEAPAIQLYQTTLLNPAGVEAADVGGQTVDSALWIALLIREGDKPYDDAVRAEIRKAIAEKTVSLGIVPTVDSKQAGRVLHPGGNAVPPSMLAIDMPQIPASGGLLDSQDRQPSYRNLLQAPVPDSPAVIEVTLPGENDLKLWNNLEPLEEGADQMPPTLEDSALTERIITWLRITWPRGAQARVLWAGINSVLVEQRAHVSAEILPNGNGRPDQVVALANKPVLRGSVKLIVDGNTGATWNEIDDLFAAGAEVPIPDLRLPPGLESASPKPPPSEIFVLDAEAGQLRFGDGMRGKRPPDGARLRADYDYGVGSAGNVARGAINNAAVLPAGIKGSNPVRTWGGADSETVDEGEKQIARYLQHRDRLVTAEDFQTITERTPGVDIGRVEVIPVYNPLLAASEPGDAPGAVTLMVIPRYDAVHPDTPEPEPFFLNAICDYIEPRRLVTTELFVRGPTYVPIWISAGINLVAGQNAATVREAVEEEIRRYLSPLRTEEEKATRDQSFADMPNGWPLRKAVSSRELIAVVCRVAGVASANDVLSARDTADNADTIPLVALELPRIAGISVNVGTPVDLNTLRGQTPTAPASGPKVVPVPVIPDEC